MSTWCLKIIENHSAYEYLLGPNPSPEAVKEQLIKWCREGLEEDKVKNKEIATHFLIVRDILPNENFPVFVYDKADLKKIYLKYQTQDDYQVVAVYDLSDERNSF